MQDVGKILLLLGVIFLVLGLMFNLSSKLPKIPGDIYIDRPGIKIYIPWASSILISVILTLIFNFLKK